MLPAYALDALDPEEVPMLEAHLDTCPECRAALKQYRAVSDGLLLALPPKSPPPRVRARLIARLASSGAPSARASRPTRPLWQVGFGFALVALLLLNLALVIQVRTLQNQQASLTQQLQANQSALAVVAYPGGRTLSLTGTRAAGTLILNPEMNTAALFAWGLDPLDPAHTYQVWLIQPDGHRLSGGLFRPEPGQPFVSHVIVSPRPFSEFTGLGVTIEPGGGSPAPTGPRVLGTQF